jgi:hypothetical protein
VTFLTADTEQDFYEAPKLKILGTLIAIQSPKYLVERTGIGLLTADSET